MCSYLLFEEQFRPWFSPKSWKNTHQLKKSRPLSHSRTGSRRELVSFPMSTFSNAFQEAACDWGNYPHDLAQEYPQFDFSSVPKVWWYHPHGVLPPPVWTSESKSAYWQQVCKHRLQDGFIEPMDDFVQRVQEFKVWIRNRKESKFLLFGHHDFFDVLTTELSADGIQFGKSLKNCEVFTYHL